MFAFSHPQSALRDAITTAYRRDEAEAVAVAAMGADVGAAAVAVVEAVAVAPAANGAWLVSVGQFFRRDAERGQDVPPLVAGGVAQFIASHGCLPVGRAGVAGAARRRRFG